MSEKSGRPRLLPPYPSTEGSTPTGGSGPETLQPRSRMEPRNERPSEVAVRLNRKKKTVRNGVPRSRVSWRKALRVRGWRMRYENTTLKQVQFSRTRRNCPLHGERVTPSDRNDRMSKKRPRSYVLVQVPYARAARRCLRNPVFRCL
jgi:hypothetical protein